VIVVVGLSHKTAPVDVREKLAASPDLLPAVLARMAARKELKEVVFLSTCNRVEVFATADGTVDGAVRAIREEIAAYAGTATSDELIACLYERSGDEAVRHIFRVAASFSRTSTGAVLCDRPTTTITATRPR
jgi:glutamyl-tRNA reductase